MVTPRVKDYVEEIFDGVPNSKRLREFKEEVAANLGEKISDYMAAGLGEAQAYHQAIGTVGDIRDTYLSQHKPRKIWKLVLVLGVCALLSLPITECRRTESFLDEIGMDHMKFWNIDGPEMITERTILTTDSATIDYSVYLMRGRLVLTVYDSMGLTLWRREFTTNDSGVVVVPVTNKGQTLLAIRGVNARGGLRFAVKATP